MKRHRSLAAVAACAVLFVAALPRPASAVSASVTLNWTATGDDGRVGQAARYELRYSTLVLTPANFMFATLVPGAPSPKPSGQREAYTVTNLAAGKGYYFALKAIDEAGNPSEMSNVVFHSAPLVGIDGSALPLSFSTPWPNPAVGSARFAYSLPNPAALEVDVFDIAGRHVRTLATGPRDAGESQLVWDLRDAAASPVRAGVYRVRARVGEKTWTRSLTVVR